MHKHGIIHKDFKISNMLIDDQGVIKLTDPGYFKLLKQNRTDMLFGSERYTPPEIPKGQ